MKEFWDTLSKEAFAYCLALIIILSWLALIFLHRDEAPTLTNVIMIIVGYIYGSSTGSKRKDDAIIPPVPAGAAVSTTTATTTITDKHNASES